MIDLDKLIRKGYFPKELPPAFSTESFARVILSDQRTAASFLVAPDVNGKLVSPDRSRSRLCRHTLSMPNGTGRPLHIPHPVHYFALCRALTEGSSEIIALLQATEFSISRPIEDPDGRRAYIPEAGRMSRIARRLYDRAKGSFLIRTDVANFYGSVYSHSIPWALHGKDVAKSRQSDDSLVGNKIDRYVRNAQEGQTIGIAVGTDASFLIAEIILSAVDQLLLSEYPSVIGFRFYDDYEIVCGSEREANQVLVLLEDNLANFELHLNRRKTAITPLPFELDHPWLTRLRSLKLPSRSVSTQITWQPLELVDYANEMFVLATQYPNDRVLRYGLVQLIKGLSNINPEVWKLYQSFLLQCFRSEPQLAQVLAQQLLLYHSKGYSIDKEGLRGALVHQIIYYATRHGSNEVAWAIWLAILFKIKLPEVATATISRLRDSVVTVLAIHARECGLLEGSLDSAFLTDMLTFNSVYSEHWLAAYEIPARDSELPSNGSNYLESQWCFENLNRAGVRFYDTDSYSDHKALLKKPEINIAAYGA